MFPPMYLVTCSIALTFKVVGCIIWSGGGPGPIPDPSYISHKHCIWCIVHDFKSHNLYVMVFHCNKNAREYIYTVYYIVGTGFKTFGYMWYATCPWLGEHGLIHCMVFKWTNDFYAQPMVACVTWPNAEAVGGWRRPNRPTVCTVGAVAPGARI